MRRRHRLLGLAAAAAAAAAACAVPRLSPEQGRPADAPLVAQGVELRVLANAWRGYPSWLPQRFTPMWLYFINRGGESFDVTYASLQLVDETGESFPAIPPTLVARELMGARDGDAASPTLALAQAETEAGPRAPPRIPAPEPLPPASAPAPPTAESGRERSSVYYGLAPYQYAFEGAGTASTSSAGRSAFGYQAPFSPFGAIAIGREAHDIVVPALREGRLLPNTHAEGFVYFRADRSARRLELRLSARNERAGGAPLVVSVPFTYR